MAEMTAQEAIEYIKKAKSQLLWNPCEVIKFIQQQAQTIESLKCCDNCTSFNRELSNKCNTRNEKFSCDKWEGLK